MFQDLKPMGNLGEPWPEKKICKSQCLWVTVPAKSRKMVDHPPNMRKCSIITDQIGGRSYVFAPFDERIEQARSAKIGKNSETIRTNDNISKQMGWFDSCFFQEFAKQNSISCAWQHMLLLIRWSTLSVALKRFKAWLKHVYSTSALWRVIFGSGHIGEKMWFIITFIINLSFDDY